MLKRSTALSKAKEDGVIVLRTRIDYVWLDKLIREAVHLVSSPNQEEIIQTFHKWTTVRQMYCDEHGVICGLLVGEGVPTCQKCGKGFEVYHRWEYRCMGTGKGGLTKEDIDKMNAAFEMEALRELDERVIRQMGDIYDSLLREAGV